MALNSAGSGISSLSPVQRLRNTFDSKNLTGDLSARQNTHDRIPAIYSKGIFFSKLHLIQNI